MLKSVRLVFQNPQGQVESSCYPWCEGLTIADVITASGCQLEGRAVGIFGKIKEPSTLVYPGERVEIYAPLRIDPKDARRARAKKKTK